MARSERTNVLWEQQQADHKAAVEVLEEENARLQRELAQLRAQVQLEQDRVLASDTAQKKLLHDNHRLAQKNAEQKSNIDALLSSQANSETVIHAEQDDNVRLKKIISAQKEHLQRQQGELVSTIRALSDDKAQDSAIERLKQQKAALEKENALLKEQYHAIPRTPTHAPLPRRPVTSLKAMQDSEINTSLQKTCAEQKNLLDKQQEAINQYQADYHVLSIRAAEAQRRSWAFFIGTACALLVFVALPPSLLTYPAAIFGALWAGCVAVSRLGLEGAYRYANRAITPQTSEEVVATGTVNRICSQLGIVPIFNHKLPSSPVVSCSDTALSTTPTKQAALRSTEPRSTHHRQSRH